MTRTEIYATIITICLVAIAAILLGPTSSYEAALSACTEHYTESFCKRTLQ